MDEASHRFHENKLCEIEGGTGEDALGGGQPVLDPMAPRYPKVPAEVARIEGVTVP